MALAARAASTRATRPRLGARVWLCALLSIAAAALSAPSAAQAPTVQELRSAERSAENGVTRTVTRTVTRSGICCIDKNYLTHGRSPERAARFPE